jgi:hypothetical protein
MWGSEVKEEESLEPTETAIKISNRERLRTIYFNLISCTSVQMISPLYWHPVEMEATCFYRLEGVPSEIEYQLYTIHEDGTTTIRLLGTKTPLQFLKWMMLYFQENEGMLRIRNTNFVSLSPFIKELRVDHFPEVQHFRSLRHQIPSV